MTRHLLSFDIEDWFHSHNLWPALDRTKWDEYELRVVENTHTILDLLDKHNTQATFFVLGHVAERAPDLVREIDARGHEVASHGYNHELLYEQSRSAVRADIRRSMELLEPLVDAPISGYRAPSFSITDWAVEMLAELGFAYDSSNFPVSMHDRYGSVPVTGSETITSVGSLVEVQLPLLELLKFEIPWAGGGYFRFIPYRLYEYGVRQISDDRDFVFYLHPWELDPNQPQVDGIPRSHKLRHYTNLGQTRNRLDRLLGAFDWMPIEDAL